MLQGLIGYFSSAAPWRALVKASGEKQTTAVYETVEGQRAFLAAALAQVTGRQVLYIAPNDASALKAADDCAQWLGGEAAVLPAGDTQFTRGTASRDTAWRRLSVLMRARKGDLKVLCAPADALMTRMTPPAVYDAATVRLKVGDIIKPLSLLVRLTDIGYERVDMVEGRGQCAMRGAILDVFPPESENALRIEFFDDEIDSLRDFDCVSQRSNLKLKSAELPPAVEWLLPRDQRAETAEKMRALIKNQMKRRPATPLSPSLPPMPQDDDEEIAQRVRAPIEQRFGLERLFDDADELARGEQLPSLSLWAGALPLKQSNLLDWMKDCIVVLDAPDRVKTRCEDRLAGFLEDFKSSLERQEAVPEQAALLLSWDEILPSLQNRSVLAMQDFLRGMGEIKVGGLIQLTAVAAPKFQSRFKEIVPSLDAWAQEGYLSLLLAGGSARARRLQTAMEGLERPLPVIGEEKALLTPGSAAIASLTLSQGFVVPALKIAIVADSDIFGAGYRKARTRKNAGERIEAFTDLREGDYVVHEAHGVGIFRGTTRIQSEGTYRDYLLIQYKGNDKLYVPTDQFDRVQKFIGGQDAAPPLNSLGGNEWDRQKKKVKAGLKKLAFDLVNLYAARAATPGHAFAPDTPWQRQFEDVFPYELTPDQARAVRDITQDMEKPSNMDRLICGDVGYGKTEVALRAAFKAVMDGKQVALLAPTTILAQQHYYTMLKRFADFPVTLDVLSRFRSAAQQKETLKKLVEGKIDILVGTHRLLGKDVHFKSLGLLIIDEEQRFGVAHKEVIKNYKREIDVLTLSATPIPRTLHMSMVGVRDMSLLETPPEERYPVQTYVLDYNDAVIRDAIMRELARGGQVYFLYNQVRNIDMFHARLRALAPEARIAVAHGQMNERALEDIMLDFYEGRYDVLLCSTIIENGLDVPKANTLIVYDADRFGLSQLYQLRGRVGRSTRVAYAYFTVRPDKMLSEDAQKRLSAIREFTAFGSGFRIAMRDLEIRGAGNIFGPEQSGNVAVVGYDMYCKLIEEAVREARGDLGDIPEHTVETRVDMRIDAFLPVEYVRGDVQRMEVYKRISLIKNREDREDAIEEIIDRFGDIPEPVMNLIDIAHLRGVCGAIGVNRVTYTSGSLVMRLEPSAVRDTVKLYQALEKADKRLLLSVTREPAILLRDGRLDPAQMLRAAVPVMEKVADAVG